MSKKANPSKQYRIYLKAKRQWVEVTEEYYRDHIRYCDAFRKRQQSHGCCKCPKNKFWLCDTDCCNCEFRLAGDQLSLNHETDGEGGDTWVDMLEDPSPSVEDVILDRIELEQLFKKLHELMPEALEIGKLRQKGLTDDAIAKAVGIKCTTFRFRLEKVKEQLAAEFPERF